MNAVQRLTSMRIVLIIVLILRSLKIISQKCESNSPLRVVLCPHLNDSTCAICSSPSADYRFGLYVCEPDYRVTQFIMMVSNADNTESDEVKVNSSFFSSSSKAMKFIANFKTRDTVSFFCIRLRIKKEKFFYYNH